jgi:hypothetical protein
LTLNFDIRPDCGSSTPVIFTACGWTCSSTRSTSAAGTRPDSAIMASISGCSTTPQAWGL